MLDQSNLFFWLIEPNFWPIENFKILEEYLLPGSIGTRSILDWSNFERRLFLKRLFTHVFFILSKAFSIFFSILFLDRSNLSLFVIFFLNISNGFCPQALVRPKYPFLFNLITFFMHFFKNILNIGNLGFSIFRLFLFTFDHWVFVLRCFKHHSHALIWSIWCFENNWKF